MTFLGRPLDRDRAVSALAVAMVHAALGWALLTGLGVSVPQVGQQVLDAFDVSDPPPPVAPPPPPPRPLAERAPRDEGAAAPPNLTSRATEVVAPDTPIPLPPPVVVAELPGTGGDPTSGNADVVGPGTGSGGIGDGTGSGRYGSGPGGGGMGGRPARLTRSGLGGNRCEPGTPCPYRVVGIRFTVSTSGRATGCEVTATSGDAALDRETCRRIEDRLRYEPARDRTGRKIPQVVTGEHEWLPHADRREFESDD